jgi:hypothetical protein
VGANEKVECSFANECSCQGWLGWSLSWFRRSNSDVNVAWDHLDLVEGVHAFRSDPFLLDLEVCNSTFKCLKMPIQTAWWLKLWFWLTRDKILWRLMEKIGCKHLILISRLNGGGCSLWGCWNVTFSYLKVPPWSIKKLKKKKHSTLYNVV